MAINAMLMVDTLKAEERTVVTLESHDGVTEGQQVITMEILVDYRIALNMQISSSRS